MREPTIARDRERGATGIVDTLSSGYAVVNRHPWIVVIPVLLDLFLWLGPRLSLAPLVERAFAQIATPTGLSGDLLQSYQEYWQTLQRSSESFNVLSLLATNYPGVPSLMAGREGIGGVTALSQASTVLGLLVLIPLAGTWIAALYYATVARQVRGGGGPREIWGRTWHMWLRLLGFLLLMIVAITLVGVSVLGLLFFVGSLSGDVLGIVGSFLFVIAMWIQFYLFFVVDAMAISDAGPLRAIRNSLVVVRFNMGPSLGLVVLIWIIMLGMPVVWGALADNPVGTVAAILGNAYISTGLAVASMAFYKERFEAITAGYRGQGTGIRSR